MSENTTELVGTETLADDEQAPVSTRIPELSNIILVGKEEFYINAKKAEEASKVSEKLLINCVGTTNVTQVSYNGEKQKSISVVPASGGRFKGPIFARSSVTVSENNNEISVDDNAVVIAGDFANLYKKHITEAGGVTAAEAIKANTADQLTNKISISTRLDKTNSTKTDFSSTNIEIGIKGVLPVANGGTGKSSLGEITVGQANNADLASKANTLQIIETTNNNSSNYINFYLGSSQPSDEAPIGSIWIKTES